MLDDFRPEPGVRYALVFGNEVEGVGQEAVDRCDGAIEIPQAGTKHSLNVSVSGGVVLWSFFSPDRPAERRASGGAYPGRSEINFALCPPCVIFAAPEI